MSENSFYQFKVKNIDGNEINLSQYKGKVILIVNTASKCGYTSQYSGLEEIYTKYKGQNFVVLGFPCNQFGGQEPEGEDAIKSFCEINFGVTFPLFSKVDVNGSNALPLYEYLKQELPGILGTQAIKWNFTKFLIDKEGAPWKRYAPTDTPQDIEKDIASLLEK